MKHDFKTSDEVKMFQTPDEAWLQNSIESKMVSKLHMKHSEICFI
jgi:hypothetical protein